MEKDKKLKILITSVGSLVGQNIHDVLDYPLFNRREKVEVIGTNSIAGSPNNFRCDRCFIVPNTNTEGFKKQLTGIILKEKPDLILSGRDEDTETVAFLMERDPGLSGRLPYGKASSLKYALNKWETWQFCQKHGLPFANTFVKGLAGDKDALRAFVEGNGFPLIAKPIQGFASKGVFFVRSWEDAMVIWDYEDYMYQEYLGDGGKLSAYFKKMDGMTPLFAHAPGIYHHSCHTVISPDGEIDDIFISRNEHDSGVTIGFRKVTHPVLEDITIKYAKAIYQEGGYGPVTVQFREDKQGNWKAQEMNMRTNGNTFPRFMMGQDDLGLIVKNVLPEFGFPVYHAPKESREYVIGKTLTSYVMLPQELEGLKEQKHWDRNG